MVILLDRHPVSYKIIEKLNQKIIIGALSLSIIVILLL